MQAFPSERWKYHESFTKSKARKLRKVVTWTVRAAQVAAKKDPTLGPLNSFPRVKQEYYLIHVAAHMIATSSEPISKWHEMHRSYTYPWCLPHVELYDDSWFMVDSKWQVLTIRWMYHQKAVCQAAKHHQDLVDEWTCQQCIYSVFLGMWTEEFQDFMYNPPVALLLRQFASTQGYTGCWGWSFVFICCFFVTDLRSSEMRAVDICLVNLTKQQMVKWTSQPRQLWSMWTARGKKGPWPTAIWLLHSSLAEPISTTATIGDGE